MHTTRETNSHLGSGAGANTFDETARETPPRALAQVVEVHQQVLFGYARFLCRTRADAWDLFQDAIERALRSGAPLSAANARAWLFKVMRNLHADGCRRASRRRYVELTEDLMLFAAEDTTCEEPGWLDTDPADVRACLTRIDPRLRDAYVLRAEQGLSLSAIAERLGIPKTTAGTRIFRARRQLQRLLARDERSGHRPQYSRGLRPRH